MRKLILATASVFALGLAASGAGYAQQPGGSAPLPESNMPSATTPSATTPSADMPSADMPSSTAPPSTGMTPPGTQSTAPVHLSQNRLRQVQEKLKTAGLYKGRIDGRMGPETRHAIAQFQEKNGLQGTGRLDQQTLAALGTTGMNNGTSGAGSSVTPGTQPSDAGGPNGSGDPNLQPGASGNPAPSTNPHQP